MGVSCVGLWRGVGVSPGGRVGIRGLFSLYTPGTQAGLGGEGRAGQGEPQCEEPTHRSTGGLPPHPQLVAPRPCGMGGGPGASCPSSAKGEMTEAGVPGRGWSQQSPGPYAGLGQIPGCPSQAAASRPLGHSGAGFVGPDWLPGGLGGLKTRLCCLGHSARVPGASPAPYPQCRLAKGGTAAAPVLLRAPAACKPSREFGGVSAPPLASVLSWMH